MDFTIVTPSYRQLDHLACCIASVADQGLCEGENVRKSESTNAPEALTVEHIVQDAGTEGFAEFAERMQERWPDRDGYRRIMVSEPDGGMYDAINKGLKRGRGQFCAHLNCDEQYLPGALAAVKKEFVQYPSAEILYGGFLVVDEHGQLVTAQRPVRMFWPHVATSHLPNFTCATFFLRSMLERDQAWFDSSYRACGDAAWTIERLKARVPSRVSKEWLSVFTESQANQGVGQTGLAEADRIRGMAPAWARAGGPLWKLIHRLRKLTSGGYRCQPIRYAIFRKEAPLSRSDFFAERASPVWRARLFMSR